MTIDTINRTLKRAGYIVITYTVLDVLVALLLSAQPCADCTPQQIANRVGAFIGALIVDIIIAACAYYGMRGKTAAFITTLVLLCIRAAFVSLVGVLWLGLITAFFAYWAYVGTATSIKLNRDAALQSATRRLPPVVPDETLLP